MLSNTLRDIIENIFAEFGLYNAEISELILLVHPACPKCEDLKKDLAEAIEQGYIRVVSALSDEGKRIVDTLNIDTWPSLVAVFEDGSMAKCKYWFEDGDFVFEIEIGEDEGFFLPETYTEKYEDGTLAITCIDPILKNQLATILLDKLNLNKPDDWFLENITPFLMSLPECPQDTFSPIGFGEVKKPKKKRRKRKSLPKVGIVALCKEAKEFLTKYEPKVKELHECELIEFAPVKKRQAKLTPYLEFMKKCLSEVRGKDKFKICVERWNKIKSAQ